MLTEMIQKGRIEELKKQSRNGNKRRKAREKGQNVK
jgi:hypothetical protein